MRAFLETADEYQFWNAMDTYIQNPEVKNDQSSSSARETPLRLLIKQFPDLAKMALDRCLSTNLAKKGVLRGEDREKERMGVTAAHEDFTITLRYIYTIWVSHLLLSSLRRYELIDDSFVIIEKQKDINIDQSVSVDDLWVSKQNTYQKDFQSQGTLQSLVLNEKAETYHKSATVLKNNHPLALMLEEEQLVSIYNNFLFMYRGQLKSGP